jgi:hypothetical protein
MDVSVSYGLCLAVRIFRRNLCICLPARSVLTLVRRKYLLGRGEPIALALNSITPKPSLLYGTEIYFAVFNQTPAIHLNCRHKTNIDLKSGKITISDEGWEHIVPTTNLI